MPKTQTTIDQWVVISGEEFPPPPPTVYYLDPEGRRGGLVVGGGSWHDAGSDYSHGCQVALELSRHPYKDRFTTPWGVAAVASHRQGFERTSLLPVEAD